MAETRPPLAAEYGCRLLALFLPDSMVSVLRTSDLGLFLRGSQVSASGSWPILGCMELALILCHSCDPHIAAWIGNVRVTRMTQDQSIGEL